MPLFRVTCHVSHTVSRMYLVFRHLDPLSEIRPLRKRKTLPNSSKTPQNWAGGCNNWYYDCAIYCTIKGVFAKNIIVQKPWERAQVREPCRDACLSDEDQNTGGGGPTGDQPTQRAPPQRAPDTQRERPTQGARPTQETHRHAPTARRRWTLCVANKAASKFRRAGADKHTQDNTILL